MLRVKHFDFIAFYHQLLSFSIRDNLSRLHFSLTLSFYQLRLLESTSDFNQNTLLSLLPQFDKPVQFVISNSIFRKFGQIIYREINYVFNVKCSIYFSSNYFTKKDHFVNIKRLWWMIMTPFIKHSQKTNHIYI